MLLAGWGACNRFGANTSPDALPGFGIHLAASKPWPAIFISADNVFNQAASGVTNAQLSAGAPGADACQPSSSSVSCN